MSHRGLGGRIRGFWVGYKTYLMLLLVLVAISTILAAEAAANVGGSFKVHLGMSAVCILAAGAALWVYELKKEVESLRGYARELQYRYRRETGKEPPKPPLNTTDV